MEGVVLDALTGSAEDRAPLWGRFDPDWYRRSYPIAAEETDLLGFYLEQGMKLGHSPNRFFDEAFYVAEHEQVAHAIAEGRVASGFEHYCLSGRDELPAHWLFEPGLYRQLHPDLTDAALIVGGFANLYDHYLKRGAQEGRQAHLLFSPQIYGRHMADQVGYPVPPGLGAFHHYLDWIDEGWPEVTTSPYFDAAWYLLHYPEVEQAIGERRFKCALHHYLSNPEPSAFDPLEYFRERFYIERYGDIEKVIGRGKWFRNAYQHFLRYGQHELRNPTSHINLQYYWARRSSVVVNAELAKVVDPFAHLLTVGLLKGLPFAPTGAPVDVPEKQARALFLSHAENMIPQHARRPIDFSFEGRADVCVIVVVHNHLAMTLMTLASLRDNYAGAIQLLLVDSGSTDEARQIQRYVKGMVHLRFETNIGFIHACNSALLHADAAHILFLNNDVKLSTGAVAAAMARLAADARVGAVGAKVIRTNEKLQEAGCIIWRDGKTSGYMRDWAPLSPEANFVRDVDFVSGVFLMARSDLIAEIGGFDPQFAPAYYEDADLCLQIWGQGYRVVYDPNVVVYHYEYGSSRDSGAAFGLMHKNQKAFHAKHLPALKHRFPDTPEALLEARFAGRPPPKILFIEDYIPLRSLGAGAVRSNDIIRVMAEMGYQVTVFPVHGTAAPLAEIYADFPDTVEIIHDLNHHDFNKFIHDRKSYFDCIWICRAHNLNFLHGYLDGLNLNPNKTSIVLDTEAIFSLREALQARREGRPFDLDEAMAREFQHGHFCQEIVTVSQAEAETLHRSGFPHARVVGTYRPVTPTPRRFEDRAGLLFVGSLYAENTPNYDSLNWFVDEILPRVEAELGWETRLNLVGHVAPGLALDRFLAHSRVTWHGPVDDLVPIYDACRIAIAPTRFAAGTPYKVYEAASFGVPAVITDLLAGQLGWKHEQEVLSVAVDDSEGFAAAIVRLYRSQTLWQRLRQGCCDRLASDHNKERYREALSQVLPPLDRPR